MLHATASPINSICRFPRQSTFVSLRGRCSYFGQPVFGLHSMMPPSDAANIGVATATYVQAKPTIRINILTARFMDCSPCVQVPWERKPSRPELYSHHCRSKVKLLKYAKILAPIQERSHPQETPVSSGYSIPFKFLEMRLAATAQTCLELRLFQPRGLGRKTSYQKSRILSR